MVCGYLALLGLDLTLTLTLILALTLTLTRCVAGYLGGLALALVGM